MLVKVVFIHKDSRSVTQALGMPPLELEVLWVLADKALTKVTLTLRLVIRAVDFKANDKVKLLPS